MASKSKILFMIDDEILYESLSRELHRFNYLLLKVGENPVQKVFDEVPHLVIIDEGFRDGEGRQVAQAVKQDPVLKWIPIVLLVEDKSLSLNAKTEWVDFFLEKGEGLPHLISNVRQALNRNYHELDVNPLTHLPGSRSSVLRIERAFHSKRIFSVCYIDLSDLAVYNLAYGDAHGDEIIVKLGEIIREAIEKEGLKEDFVGHLGGDDFIIVTNPERAVKLAEIIIRKFDAVITMFYDANDRRHGYISQKDKNGSMVKYPFMSVSIAIVDSNRFAITSTREIGAVASELKGYMKTIPSSCYVKCKAKEKNEVPQPQGRLLLEVNFPGKKESLIVASPPKDSEEKTIFDPNILRSKKIQTVYQPIVEVKGREVTGYEALTRGMAGTFLYEPALLFKSAREAGMIKEMDKLCVDFALKRAQSLGRDKKLFINLNLETLIDPIFMKSLFSEKGDIDFKNIVIEVTEQSILRSFDKVCEALIEIKEKGASVAIDDMGGGAVSLRDVAVLKPDYIKFDRSLIRQINTSITKQQIVLSLILFANGIHARTVAEGIETKKEYETVEMLGITYAQGFYFAKPGKPFPEVFMG